MTSRLFSLLKWGALARGIWRGLTYRKPAITVLMVDRAIKERYLATIREQLNAPSPLSNLFELSA